MRRVALAISFVSVLGIAHAMQAQVCGLCGDADGSGQVDIVDAMFIAQQTVGLRAAVPCPSDADVNMSVGIDIVDALFIAQLTLDLRTTLACAPPFSIRIDVPTSLQLFGASPITVSGTLAGTVSSVTCNGESASLTPTSFNATVPITEGNTIVTCVAADALGRTSTASVTVELDTTPPRVVIHVPSEGANVTQSPVVVTGMVNDVVVGTVNEGQVQVVCNQVTGQVANRTFAASGVPLSAGPNTITCTATDRAGNVGSATTIVTLDTAPMARVNLVSGDQQSGPIGQSLPAPLVVSVTDVMGGPVPNQPVIFKVVENDGLLMGGGMGGRSVVVMSDATGRAAATYTLGSRAGFGNNQVQATVLGFAREVVFCASALVGTPAAIVVDQGTNQRGVVGQPLAKPFVAIVIDAGNNRLANVPVTFTVAEGGGSFGGQSGITVPSDSDGRAPATLTLGTAVGFDNNVVAATFTSNPGASAMFVASGELPGDPAQTKLSGTILDNTDTPVPGATLIIANTFLSTTSDAEGYFEIVGAPAGRIILLVDGATVQRPGRWPNLEYELVLVPGANNTVGRGAIYLLPLELPGQAPSANMACVDATTGGKITLAEVPGFELTILPGSALFPNGSRQGCVTVTPVHPDKAPMVPSFGQQPRFIVTIQPAGTRFDPPAPLAIPNSDGLPPGQKVDMYSYDHELLQFVSIGTGTVSEDGTVVRSDSGVGVIKAGWHCGGNPEGIGTCEHKCDDGNDCTDDFGFAGGCLNLNAEEGTPCRDVDLGKSFECVAGVKIQIDDSCKGACTKDAVCQAKSDRHGIALLAVSVQDACEKIFSDCMPAGALRTRMRDNLKANGFKILCVDGPDTNDDGMDDCGSAALNGNTLEISNLSGSICGVVEKTIRHEMQHGAGGQDHAYNPDGTFDCANDPVFGCDVACSGFSNCAGAKAANCK